MAYFNCLHKLLPMEIEASGKRTASGTVVSLTDVSPVEHEMKVKVAPKNLISYPYDETTKTEDGYTFTDNGDGSVTVSGTNTMDWAVDFYFTHALELPAGEYVLSTDGGAVENCRIIYYGASFGEAPLGDETVHVTLTQAETVQVLINVFADVVDNLTLTPKIQPVAIADSITRYGKNLLDSAGAKFSGNSTVESQSKRHVTVSQTHKSTYTSANFRLPKLPEGTIITVQAKAKTSGDNRACLRVLWMAGNAAKHNTNIQSSAMSGETEVLLKATGAVPPQPEGYNNLCLLLYSNTNGDGLESGVTYTAIYSDIQVEIAGQATEFEPYKGETPYPVNEDGTVDGVMSILPVTNMLTDTDDVINVEYMNSLCIKIDGNFIKMKARL